MLLEGNRDRARSLGNISNNAPPGDFILSIQNILNDMID